MSNVNPSRRRIVLALATALGGSLAGCIAPPGVVRPNPGQSKSTSKRSAQDAFGAAGGNAGIDPILRQRAQFRVVLAAFRQDFLRGDAHSYEALNERLTVPYVELLRSLFASVQEPSGAKANTAKIVNGKITIPPGATLTYTQKGYCMNKSLPAPVGGDALILKPVAGEVDADMLPILKAVGEWSVKSPENASRAQMLTWGLMDVGTDRGGWIKDMNPDMRQMYDEIYPGASRRMIGTQGGYELTKKALGFVLEKTKLNRYISTDMLLNSTQDHHAANNLLDELIKIGKQSTDGKGVGFSTIAENVHARASGGGPLVAQIEVFNDGDAPFEYTPMDYYANPAAQKQRISPTPNITDVVLNAGGFLSSELQKRAIEIAKEATDEIVNELRDKIYDKVFDGLEKKTPGAARATRKLMRNSALGKALAVTIGATPIIGNLLSAREFITGTAWDGTPLSPTDRLIAGLGIVPGANTLRAIGKGIQSAKVVKLSKNNFFKFVDSKEYGDIKSHLEVAGEIKEAFEDPGKALMKTLILEAALPWNQPTLRLIGEIRAGTARF